MTDIERYTIEQLTGVTSHITDKHRNLAVLAYAKQRSIPIADVVQIIIAKRYSWLNWLTMTQRRWQRNTRNPNKAKHHDSIELREKYVRC